MTRSIIVASALVIGIAAGTCAQTPDRQPANDPTMPIWLRLRGSAEAIPLLRTCLQQELSKLPDVRVVSGSTSRPRFVLDITVTKAAENRVTAGFVVLSTFPTEDFAPALAAVGDKAASLAQQLPYYTLLRQHDLVADLPSDQVCVTIAEAFHRVSLEPEIREQND